MKGNIAKPWMPHTKRFRLIFSIWGHSLSDSVSDFDTPEGLKEETKLIKEFYRDTPRPKKSKKYGCSWDYSEGGSFWGYIALDYEKEEVLEVYKDGARIYHENQKGGYVPEVLKKEILRIKDLMFRGEDEIPENYKWDTGEYEGWLKYRWGDGLNAIKPRVQKKNLGGNSRAEAREEDPNAIYDELAEKELIQRKLDRW